MMAKGMDKPPGGQWKNLWREIYEDEWGKEETELRLKNQFKFPEAGLFSGLGLCIETRKLTFGFSLVAKQYQKRPSHAYGVGAIGFANVLQNADIPENDFFTPGRSFRIRLRHGNFRYHDDDASVDGRSASIKFDDVTEGGLFDLVMNTGKINFFQNVPTFMKMAALAREPNADLVRKEVFDRPVNLQTTIEYLRRAPSSYTHLHYYALMTYLLQPKTGNKLHVRFRLIPDDVINMAESGLPNEAEQRSPWKYERLPDETRPTNYLREHFKTELQQRELKYHLEIQIHDQEYSDKSDPELFNSSVEWDPVKYPWRRLVEMNITTPISEEETEKTFFNLSNRPSCLTYPSPKSKYDYNSIPYAREKVYSKAQAVRIDCTAEYSDKQISYSVITKTKVTGGAGTDSDIYISIVGTECRTEPCLLDRKLRNDFEQGNLDVYMIKGVEVGEMLAIEVFNKNPRDDLMLDYVVVYDCHSKQSAEFPSCGWIGARRILPRGETCPMYREFQTFLRQLSLHQQSVNRGLYLWQRVEGLPSHLTFETHADLPLDVKFTDEKQLDFFLGFAESKIRFGAKSKFFTFKDEESYLMFANGCFAPKDTIFKYYHDNWRKDEEFGRLAMNGCNPLTFRRCDVIPEKFPVTSQMVEPVIGQKLEEALKAGRIFISDYEILQDLPRYKKGKVQRYVTDPIALLYARPDGNLVPIAIQLNQQPGDENPIWLPTDSEADWLTAKTWVRCADVQIHQIYTHLLRAHFVIEVFAVATKRNLPELHPIYKLLIPHIRHTIAINTIGRISLVGEGKIVDQVMALGGGGHIELLKKSYQQLNLNDFFLPESLKSRGVDDVTIIPHYHYRDDALLHWQALSDYVSDVIDLFYHQDDDVMKDTAIQEWMLDIQKNGFVHWENDVEHGVPEAVKGVAELKRWCTMIIFTASVGHAVTNFSQHDVYGFIPVSPPAMHTPPPNKKGEMTVKKLLDSLPKHEAAADTLAQVYGLSRYSSSEVYLGDFPEDYFGEKKPREIQAKYRERLVEVSTLIKTRNLTRHLKYEYLLPERIPNSITI